MARINIDKVRKDVIERGWKVLDLEYKNLQTPMTFICDKGHEVNDTWAKVRGRFQCPECIENRRKKIKTGNVKDKEEGTRRILALDQATHTTGYSIFDDQQLVAYGTYESTGSSAEQRILDVCDWLERMIDEHQPDMVGIEDIQYNPYGGGHNTFKMLGQLMGAIMRTAEQKGVLYQSVLISTWRKSANVSGRGRKEQKASAQRVVKGRYGLVVSEDEADAICIGIHYSKARRKKLI